MSNSTELIHNHMPDSEFGLVNLPIYNGSTVVYRDYENFVNATKDRFSSYYKTGFGNYGRFGNIATNKLEKLLADAEFGKFCILTPSGLSALTNAIYTFVKFGDHILITDTCYYQTKAFVRSLSKINVSYTIVPIGIKNEEIKNFIKENTTLFIIESPGSQLLEVLDIEFIAKFCKEKNIVSIFDNTWATPLFCNPIKFGFDVVVHSLTKFVLGHSDAMMGAIISNSEENARKIYQTAVDFGVKVDGHTTYLATRGMKTLKVRIDANYNQLKVGLEKLKQLQNKYNNKIKQILSPYCLDFPSHNLWKKFYTGATPVLSIRLDRQYNHQEIAKAINSRKLLSLGLSWGGFESMITHFTPSETRIKESGYDEVSYFRIYLGFEEIDDIINDIELVIKNLPK
jgi:cystathionine beta-lyase